MKAEAITTLEIPLGDEILTAVPCRDFVLVLTKRGRVFKISETYP